MITPSLLQEAPDFSLVPGGPLYQLLRRAHLTGPVLEQLRRRILVITLITWLPLALIGGNLSGVKLTFLHDIEVHVRFLIAVPVLIAAELIVHRRIRIIVKRFVERGIVKSEDMPKFHAAIDAAMRLRNSVPLEVVLLILIHTAGHWIWRSQADLGTARLVRPAGGSQRAPDALRILVRICQHADISTHPAALVSATLHLVPIPVEGCETRSALAACSSRPLGRVWLSGCGHLRFRADPVRGLAIFMAVTTSVRNPTPFCQFR